MIIGVYATLGVFLLIASRNPYAHKSLIWFTVWSSVVHGAIMGVQALSDPAERGHLVGDVPALILVAIILAVLTPFGLHKLESAPGLICGIQFGPRHFFLLGECVCGRSSRVERSRISSASNDEAQRDASAPSTVSGRMIIILSDSIVRAMMEAEGIPSHKNARQC